MKLSEANTLEKLNTNNLSFISGGTTIIESTSHDSEKKDCKKKDKFD